MSKNKHPFGFKLGENASSFSWALSAKEKEILQLLFKQWTGGKWADGHETVLIFETLRPLLPQFAKTTGRVKLTRPQALAFNMLFKFHHTMGINEHFWLPKAMMDDIEKNIYNSTNEIDLR